MQHTNTVVRTARKQGAVVAAAVQVWEAKMTHIDPSINSDKYYDLQLLIGQYENPSPSPFYPIRPQHACIQCADFCTQTSVGRFLLAAAVRQHSPFPLMIVAAFRATE